MRGENNIDATLYHLVQARELDPTVEQFWKSSFTALISAKRWSELLNVLVSWPPKTVPVFVDRGSCFKRALNNRFLTWILIHVN